MKDDSSEAAIREILPDLDKNSSIQSRNSAIISLLRSK
jgi:hypothetical protein